jgi:hypothetical protein
MLFTDFMNDRANALNGAIGSSYYEPSHRWMEGMVKAAAELNIETQICMASPAQALDTLLMPSVTNARIDGDGGIRFSQSVYSAVLVSCRKPIYSVSAVASNTTHV